MRALKILLFIVVAVFGVLAVLSFIGDGNYRIERSVTIAAPADVVYGHVASLGAMDKWSPWNEHDPNMKKSMEGTDGTVGAVAKWEGNKEVGKGEQRIDSLAPNSFVRTHLHFMEPFENECDALIELTPDGEGTKVTWAMVGENGFMGKVMSLFMDMDAMLGPDFEKGLGYLKAQVEQAHAEAAKAPAYQMTIVDRPAMLYAGKRKVVAWADLKAFYTEQFGAGMAVIGKAGAAPAGAPSGVYFEWNETDKTADLIAGIPVPMDAKSKLKGLVDLYETPAGRAVQLEYLGGYGNMEAAHEAIDAYMKANKMEFNVNVVEEYISDPGSEPDSTKWKTNILYLIK